MKERMKGINRLRVRKAMALLLMVAFTINLCQIDVEAKRAPYASSSRSTTSTSKSSVSRYTYSRSTSTAKKSTYSSRTTSSYKTNTKTTTKKTTSSSSWLSKAKSKLSSAAKTVSSKVSNTYSKAKSAVTKTASKVSSSVKKTYSSVKSAVTKTAKKVTNSVKRAYKTVKSAVKKTVSKVSNSAKKTYSKVKSAVTKTAKKVSNSVKKTYSRVKSAVTKTAKKVSNSVKKTYSRVKSTVTKTAKKATNSVKKAYKNVTNKLKEAAKKTYTKAKETAKKAYDKALKAAKKAYKSAKSGNSRARKAAKRAYTSAKSAAKKAYDQAKKAAANAYDKAEKAAKKAINVVSSTASKAWNRYVNGVKNNLNTLASAGKIVLDETVQHGAPVLSAISTAMNTRVGRGVMGGLQVIGGAAQIAVGFALCETGIGAVIGVPLMVHGLADFGQGVMSTYYAACNIDKQGVNFMEEAYKGIGYGIGYLAGGKEGALKGQTIASGIFLAVDMGLGFLSPAAAAGIAAKAGKIQKLDKFGDFAKNASRFVRNYADDAARLGSSLRKGITNAKNTLATFGSMYKSNLVASSKSGVVLSCLGAGEINRAFDVLGDTIKDMQKLGSKADDAVAGIAKGMSNSKYLTSIEGQVSEVGKADLPGWIAESFTDSNYRTVVTNENVTLYRSFGGYADAGGGFVSTSPVVNRIQAKMDAALLPEWGNSRMYEAVIEVPEGQILNIGKVAEQYTSTGAKLTGQADQILLPQDWPFEWIKEFRNIPSK